MLDNITIYDKLEQQSKALRSIQTLLYFYSKEENFNLDEYKNIEANLENIFDSIEQLQEHLKKGFQNGTTKRYDKSKKSNKQIWVL